MDSNDIAAAGHGELRYRRVRKRRRKTSPLAGPDRDDASRPDRLGERILALMAAIFVPVGFNYGLAIFTGPAAWGVFAMPVMVFHGRYMQGLITGIEAMIFIGIELMLARLIQWLLRMISVPGPRWMLYGAICMGIFGCGFRREIGYQSPIHRNTGIYTLWEALAVGFDLK